MRRGDDKALYLCPSTGDRWKHSRWPPVSRFLSRRPPVQTELRVPFWRWPLPCRLRGTLWGHVGGKAAGRTWWHGRSNLHLDLDFGSGEPIHHGSCPRDVLSEVLVFENCWLRLWLELEAQLADQLAASQSREHWLIIFSLVDGYCKHLLA